MVSQYSIAASVCSTTIASPSWSSDQHIRPWVRDFAGAFPCNCRCHFASSLSGGTEVGWNGADWGDSCCWVVAFVGAGR